MKLALALALLSAPAAAQEVRFEDAPDGITVLYHNAITWPDLDTETFRFDSQHGPVVFVLTRTKNDSCEPMPCADRLEVVEVPDGFVAVPPEVELPELGDTTVVVRLFQGT